ncbi:MAG: hypothetical protein LBG64_00025 [Pseudomonadales bacterium]|jgi:hypothetical protein|nr:hypothetical protein [Pseudomonadales bacterium]
MLKKICSWTEKYRADKDDHLPISQKNILRFFIVLCVILALVAIYNHVVHENFVQQLEEQNL